MIRDIEAERERERTVKSLLCLAQSILSEQILLPKFWRKKSTDRRPILGTFFALKYLTGKYLRFFVQESGRPFASPLLTELQ